MRLASFGYFGHMWELYAMWTWIGLYMLEAFTRAFGELAAPQCEPVAHVRTQGFGAPFDLDTAGPAVGRDVSAEVRGEEVRAAAVAAQENAARSRVDQAHAHLDRRRSLVSQGFVAREELTEAETEYLSALTGVDEARANIWGSDEELDDLAAEISGASPMIVVLSSGGGCQALCNPAHKPPGEHHLGDRLPSKHHDRSTANIMLPAVEVGGLVHEPTQVEISEGGLTLRRAIMLAGGARESLIASVASAPKPATSVPASALRSPVATSGGHA